LEWDCVAEAGQRGAGVLAGTNFACMIKRVYIDTSVVGGYFDDEFSADTIPFFEAVKQGLFTIVASDLLDAELLKAPAFVKDLMKGMPM
jgi:hypothetical protein